VNENSRAIFLFSKITLDLIKSSFINRLQLKQTNYKLTQMWRKVVFCGDF